MSKPTKKNNPTTLGTVPITSTFKMTNTPAVKFKSCLENLIGTRIDCTEGGPYGIYEQPYWILFHNRKNDDTFFDLKLYKQRFPEHTGSGLNSKVIKEVTVSSTEEALTALLALTGEYMPKFTAQLATNLVKYSQIKSGLSTHVHENLRHVVLLDKNNPDGGTRPETDTEKIVRLEAFINHSDEATGKCERFKYFLGNLPIPMRWETEEERAADEERNNFIGVSG